MHDSGVGTPQLKRQLIWTILTKIKINSRILTGLATEWSDWSNQVYITFEKGNSVILFRLSMFWINKNDRQLYTSGGPTAYRNDNK